MRNISLPEKLQTLNFNSLNGLYDRVKYYIYLVKIDLHEKGSFFTPYKRYQGGYSRITLITLLK